MSLQSIFTYIILPTFLHFRVSVFWAVNWERSTLPPRCSEMPYVEFPAQGLALRRPFKEACVFSSDPQHPRGPPAIAPQPLPHQEAKPRTSSLPGKVFSTSFQGTRLPGVPISCRCRPRPPSSAPSLPGPLVPRLLHWGHLRSSADARVTGHVLPGPVELLTSVHTARPPQHDFSGRVAYSALAPTLAAPGAVMPGNRPQHSEFRPVAQQEPDSLGF